MWGIGTWVGGKVRSTSCPCQVFASQRLGKLINTLPVLFLAAVAERKTYWLIPLSLDKSKTYQKLPIVLRFQRKFKLLRGVYISVQKQYTLSPRRWNFPLPVIHQNLLFMHFWFYFCPLRIYFTLSTSISPFSSVSCLPFFNLTPFIFCPKWHCLFISPHGEGVIFQYIPIHPCFKKKFNGQCGREVKRSYNRRRGREGVTCSLDWGRGEGGSWGLTVSIGGNRDGDPVLLLLLNDQLFNFIERRNTKGKKLGKKKIYV
jgi:hypothetical protein